MRRIDPAWPGGGVSSRRRTTKAGACSRLFLAKGLFLAAGCASSPGGDKCHADQNGISGGTQVIFLTVSDTGFTVGAADAGPGEPNITVENKTTVKLTMTNVGTRSHDFVVRCLAAPPRANACGVDSCFPPESAIAALPPGGSATTVFVAPVDEGTYTFVSDLPGDAQPGDDGGMMGLVGQFVLL